MLLAASSVGITTAASASAQDAPTPTATTQAEAEPTVPPVEPPVTPPVQTSHGAQTARSGGNARALVNPTYSVTIAARRCTTYLEVMANRARNNIMQSLQNVGANSNYASGAAVNPTNEAALSSGQQNCVPLPGWDMKLGTGIGGVNNGPWGSLSFVSNPYAGAIQTQPSVPLLNSAGAPTGSNLDGATTIQLTPAQVTLANQHKLWLQGGVPGAPLNGNPTIAFGALRCAIDNYNGDNVEWIAFPTGAVHVFCYAIYVDIPPASATIIVRKSVTGPNPSNQVFNFGGDISYNPGGAFTLTSGQQISFVREANKPWTITEAASSPFTFAGIVCDNGQTSPSIPSIAVTALQGSTVICTFTNAGPNPTGRLDVQKITTGAVGGPFGYTFTGVAGNQTATTTAEGTAVLASGSADTSALALGSYGVTETVPAATGAGSWAKTANECFLANSNVPLSLTNVTPAGFDVNLTADTICFVTNTFTPNGKIKVQAMQTGPGSFNPTSADSTYVITDPNAVTKVQTASNSGFNSFAPAVPQTGGDVTTNLGFQNYTITGIPPQNTSAGSWAVDSVTCTSGSPVIDASNLFVTLTLSPTDYDVTCSFVYRFVPAAGSLTQTANKCATPVRAPKKKGTVTVISCRAKTNVGNVKWTVSCKARGKTSRGDVAYCKATVDRYGRVKITTYGKKITIKLKGTVAASGQYAAWSKTYTWKR